MLLSTPPQVRYLVRILTSIFCNFISYCFLETLPFSFVFLSSLLLSSHIFLPLLTSSSLPSLLSSFFLPLHSTSLLSSPPLILPLYSSPPHSSHLHSTLHHTSSLLLSLAVVECQRAGLKSSAYNYAVMLMSPDYRQHIEASIKKKIEAVVRRKSQQEEEASEELSLCPISKYALYLIFTPSS